MNWMPPETSPLGDRIDFLWKRGVRFLSHAAIAFAMSAATAIGVGIAISDNAFIQILVIASAALAFWAPFFFIIIRIRKWLAHRDTDHSKESGSALSARSTPDDDIWRRLLAVAPVESHRLAALRRSLERSRLSLGSAKLDPEAHELCILIDRRLPDLIHHELEILPPDDRHRRQKVRDLVDLVEQFARHCSRRGPLDETESHFEAEVLRRRFETRLTEF